MKKKELKKRIAKYINKTVSYGYGDGFVQIDYTSPDGVEHIYIEEDTGDDFTFIDFLEDYTLDILQQEIDRAREEGRKEERCRVLLASRQSTKRGLDELSKSLDNLTNYTETGSRRPTGYNSGQDN